MKSILAWGLVTISLAAAGGCGSSESDSGATGTDAGSDGSSPFQHECGSPSDLGAGFESCEGGWFHRPSVLQCPGTPSSYCEASCQSDPRCSIPNNQCAHVGYTGCQCTLTCKTDADCGSGSVCICGDPVGICIQASCTSDADCGAGYRCASYSSLDTCGVADSRYGVIMGGLACQTAADTCNGDGDCGTGQRCTLTDGARVCANTLPCSS